MLVLQFKRTSIFIIMDATTTTSTASTTTIMHGLVALCQEIRNANWRGEERDGRHYWSVDLDFDLTDSLQMLAINCAICGNYQMSRTLQLCSSVIVCEDEEHSQHTRDLIAIERADEDSDEYSDEDSDEDSDEYEHIIRRQ